MAILSIISMALAAVVLPQIKLSRVIEEKWNTLEAAGAAFKAEYLARLKDETPDYDTLFELKAERVLELGKNRVVYQLLDEESRINLNTAPKGILLRLPGLQSETVVDEILAYRQARPFALKEELLLVNGVDKEIYSQCRDYITVWTSGEVNVNTASATVLAALGMGERLISSLINFRKGPDGLAGTEDDGAFKNLADFINDLDHYSDLTGDEVTLLQNLISQNRLTVKSNVLDFESRVSFLSQPARRYAAVFNLSENKALRWEE
ncbi:MAG: general secretion pathway protein GspK [Candidatus Omnitrophota bacterium]